MATLTDRYIFATVRSLGPESEADVRAEFAASIADAVEARIEQGEDRAAVERAVLTELGDPGILAAGYADRPLQLIGPRYFLTWWRLLKLLLCIVPATAVAGVVLGLTLNHASLGEVIGQAWVTGLTTTVHVGFWTTLVFFILERSGADAGPSWNVDQLPETVENQPGRNEVLLMAIYSALVVGALLWDRFRGFAQVDGEPVPILGGTVVTAAAGRLHGAAGRQTGPFLHQLPAGTLDRGHGGGQHRGRRGLCRLYPDAAGAAGTHQP